MTPAQLYALSMHYNEEQEWQDYRAGIICSVIAEVNRNPKKRAKAFQPQDFMPGRGRKRKKKQTQEQMMQQIRMINTALGGKEIKK